MAEQHSTVRSPIDNLPSRKITMNAISQSATCKDYLQVHLRGARDVRRILKPFNSPGLAWNFMGINGKIMVQLWKVLDTGGQAMKADLFSTVHKKDYLSLYESGKVDYQKVIEILDFKKRDVSKASGVSEESVRYDLKMPQELTDRMTEWAAALAAVGEYFKDPQKTVLWFKIPNPLLGNVAPRDMIRVGRFPKLFRFILQALRDNERRVGDIPRSKAIHTSKPKTRPLIN